MRKKCLTWVLLLSLLPFPLFAQTKADQKAAQEAARIAQIKTTIQGYGTGEDALIEVKLKNGTKRKGYISEAKDDLFVIADTAAASSYDLRYAEVAAVNPISCRPGRATKRWCFWSRWSSWAQSLQASLATSIAKSGNAKDAPVPILRTRTERRTRRQFARANGRIWNPCQC
jgi:hypothetical protein